METVQVMDVAMQIKEQTFLKEKDRLLSFIRNRVSSTEEAEDILQDVFYQFVAGYNTIEGYLVAVFCCAQ
jgi:DNA-directed RNA polymerase specialized sigma24 family protein